MDSPLILSLDAHGVPHRWISWQQACFYYAKNLVAWTMGDETFTYYGGISRITFQMSTASLETAAMKRSIEFALNRWRRSYGQRRQSHEHYPI